MLLKNFHEIFGLNLVDCPHILPMIDQIEQRPFFFDLFQESGKFLPVDVVNSEIDVQMVGRDIIPGRQNAGRAPPAGMDEFPDVFDGARHVLHADGKLDAFFAQSGESYDYPEQVAAGDNSNQSLF